MFISEKLVFMELHKTGCSHIRLLLKKLLGGDFSGKHDQASSDLFVKNRMFLASIRNPWEWYVSLWAYGCDGKGAVFADVTNPHTVFPKREVLLSQARTPQKLFPLSNNSEKWQDTYRDVNDAKAFREWLYMIHDDKYWHALSEGFSDLALSKFAGFLTFRYMKLLCCKQGELFKIASLRSFDDLKNYEERECFVNYVIRNESLEGDLIKALEYVGFVVSEELKCQILSLTKTNSSSRRKGLAYYYDRESSDLVYERERLIVEKFSYAKPKLEC